MRHLLAPFLFLTALLGAWGLACGRRDVSVLPPDATAVSGESPPHLFGAGPNPSPACVVSDNGGSYAAASPNGINVSAGDAVTIRLASYAGVRSWALTVFGLDEVTSSSPPVLSYSVGPPGTYSFTYPGAVGRAVLLQSVVNGGVNVNGVRQPSYTTTIGVFSLTASGQRVLASGETFETCPAGWICDWNAQVRALGSGIYGGEYTSGLTSLSLTTSGTYYQATFDTTLAAARKTVVGSNGVQVTASTASAVLVTATVSWQTGDAGTETVWALYKNGVALPDAVKGSNTTTNGGYTSSTIQTLQPAVASDTYSLYASATNNTITATYLASLIVVNAGATQGVAGPPGPPGPPSTIGGGPCGVPVSGAIVLPATTQCLAVDLTSVDATVNVGSVAAYDGLAYQFDLQAGMKSILFSGGNFVSVANGSTTPLSSMSVQGGGQSVVIKYNAANAWWTTP